MRIAFEAKTMERLYTKGPWAGMPSHFHHPGAVDAFFEVLACIRAADSIDILRKVLFLELADEPKGWSVRLLDAPALRLAFRAAPDRELGVALVTEVLAR